MKRTKILCTIGPASKDVATLTKMIKAGMNAVRLNFSHGTHLSHKKLISNIRKASKLLNIDIPILQDLQGPRIRVGILPDNGIYLKKGETVIFTTNKRYKDKFINKKIFVTYNNLHKDVKKGDIILINDGLIKVQVEKVFLRDIFAKVIVGGELFSHKGLNFPDTSLTISPITDKDIEDLEFGIKNNVDFVALSFVSCAKDITLLRQLIHNIENDLRLKPKESVKIIAKIERADAIKNLDEIIEAADGIMIARGDLGIEIEPERVPILEKMIIKKCLHYPKLVIVATQMLESMMENPRPTRAELSDVANAVIDHTDVVMLSGETAMGKYPVESVNMMSKIIKETESSPYDDIVLSKELRFGINNLSNAIGLISGILAKESDINAIFLAAKTWEAVQYISRFRPEIPLVVGMLDDRSIRQANLIWGVFSFKLRKVNNTKSLIKQGLDFIYNKNLVKRGQKVLCIIGDLGEEQDEVNFMKII